MIGGYLRYLVMWQQYTPLIGPNVIVSVALLCCGKIISSVGNWYSLLVVKWLPGEGEKSVFA